MDSLKLDFDAWYIKVPMKLKMFSKNTFCKTVWDEDTENGYFYKYETNICSLFWTLFLAWMAILIVGFILLLSAFVCIPVFLYELFVNYGSDLERGWYHFFVVVGGVESTIIAIVAISSGICYLEKKTEFFSKPCSAVGEKISSTYSQMTKTSGNKTGLRHFFREWNKAHKEKYCIKVTFEDTE